MRRLIGRLFVLCSIIATPAWAQQGTTEIRGRVIDAQEAVLPGVVIVARNQDTGMFRQTVSNADGTYLITGIPPGTYELTGTLQGFSRFARRDLVLEIGKTATIDVRMTVGSVSEEVTVTAEAPIVDVTSKEVGGNITSRELVELPSINRNFVGFVGLLPGIVPTISTESFGSDSITVNGQDPRNNNYTLDGANNNDDVIGQRAGTQARTPIEAVQEFQVITNQFDAQYGRTAGAIVNAVTKQGTNAFRGSAFSFFKDASLTAKDYFAKQNDLTKPDTAEQQFGGTFGGPIVRDKAHFFASLERVRIDEGITSVFNARPDLDFSTTEQTRVWNTVLRFDNQLNASNTWGVRWLREYSPQFNQIIGSVTPAAAREEDDTDQTVVGTWTSVLGDNKVNTVRLNWTQEDVSFGNPCYNGNGRDQAACEPTLAFQTFTDQQSNVAQSRVNDAYQFEDTLSWFVPNLKGDHDIKVGAQYQYSKARSFNDGNLNGTFSFGRSNAPFDPADPATYPDRFSIRVGGRSESLITSRYFAWFVQDKWKIGPKLTLNLGVRHDIEVLPAPEVDNPLFASANDYPVDKNNIAPRIGVAYDLHGDGRDVIRGGYGRFYDKTHFELISGIYTNTVFATSFTRNFPLAAVDSGPRNGMFPTDPLLVNGPFVNRALVEAQYPSGSLLRNSGASWDNPDRTSPFTDQVTVGYSRQLRTDLGVSVDYVHAAARDLLMSLNLNPGLRATTAVTSPLVRQGSATLDAAEASLATTYPGFDPFTTNVTIPVNRGETNYDALMIQVEKRYANRWSARVSYTLSYSRGNTTGSGVPTSGFQVLDDMHLELNEGPTNFDQRHNLVISGSALVPRTGGMTLSWVARALSGSPFSLFDNTIDPDRNGSSSEPLAAGSYSGTGENAYTVDHYESKRNGAYGPGFFKLDLRAGYRFQLGAQRTLDAFVEVFNVTNRVNYSNPSGNIASANFLILNGYSTSTTPRTVQIGFRVGF
ncbi:MAG: carboxypeptidase regulatory-like domain-containing protein [Vicinamibacterales bacterium]